MCWYVVVEWHVIKHVDLQESDYEIFEETLKEVANLGLKLLNNEPEFEKWEEVGLQMLEKANLMKPEDPIIEMLYLAGKHSIKYKEACLKAKPDVKEKFKGKGKFNEYFRDVLDR